ncbi:MAG: MjaI family restriction endonuclease [Candidatus Aminicenantes bacterium]|nr:MjaI family restriction endonuclease [Candidatus Aminicenantes bacterium]NIQ71106.1 MjaI family restriction endonuclease [Candidatus Aminicenantes bacterium]NIT27166.1 MjaI family restriction endonuclease [Candidatus Aminicenantes bacterium]
MATKFGPKEWILNSANMRWQLTYAKRGGKVGTVRDLIRKLGPKSLQEWEEYYYNNVHPKAYLEELGKRLFIKITEVAYAEINSITEQDCIDYVIDVVINRTFDGYDTEIKTIYGQLSGILKVEINPAPDNWDRGYAVDFYIEIPPFFIGLQIKPAGHAYIPEIIKELEAQKRAHKKFAAKFGGKVFYIISAPDAKGRKKIQNPEVIKEIKAEIKRLLGLIKKLKTKK